MSDDPIDPTEAPGPGAGTEAAGDGIAHLQTAAREVLAAARSFLDAIEETVADRERLGAVVGSVTELLESAGRAMSSMSERIAEEAGARPGSDPVEGPVARVRRIVLDE